MSQGPANYRDLPLSERIQLVEDLLGQHRRGNAAGPPRHRGRLASALGRARGWPVERGSLGASAGRALQRAGLTPAMRLVFRPQAAERHRLRRSYRGGKGQVTARPLLERTTSKPAFVRR